MQTGYETLTVCFLIHKSDGRGQWKAPWYILYDYISSSWESQWTAACRTKLLSTWLTTVHQSNRFPADVIYGQPLDISVPHYRLSTFGHQTSVAGPTVWNSLLDSLHDPPLSSNRFRQPQKANLFQRYYSAHSAVEMPHNSTLYKYITDIDNIDNASRKNIWQLSQKKLFSSCSSKKYTANVWLRFQNSGSKLNGGS